ncbi:hypothetical protein ETB97_010940, partial [Aspergillus alliaceus]
MKAVFLSLALQACLGVLAAPVPNDLRGFPTPSSVTKHALSERQSNVDEPSGSDSYDNQQFNPDPEWSSWEPSQDFNPKPEWSNFDMSPKESYPLPAGDSSKEQSPDESSSKAIGNQQTPQDSALLPGSPAPAFGVGVGGPPNPPTSSGTSASLPAASKTLEDAAKIPDGTYR